MDEQYYDATHENFRSTIGYSYPFPVLTAWDYSNICNTAISSGLEVVAMLEDGVVYKYLNKE